MNIDCKIEKIESNETKLEVHLRYINQYESGWANINQETYIRPVGHEGVVLKIKEATSIPFAPESISFENVEDILHFSLVFPPLPQGTTHFDLIEDIHDEYAFNFFNIPVHQPEKEVFRNKTESLKKIEHIARELIKKNKNTNSFSFRDEIDRLKPEIAELESIIPLTCEEIAIFCVALFFVIEDDSFCVLELKQRTSYDPFDFFSIRKISHSLEKKGWLRKKGKVGISRRNSKAEERIYHIPSEIINAFLNNQVPAVKKRDPDIYSVTDQLYKTLHSYSDHEMDEDEFQDSLSDFETEYSSIPPFSTAMELKLDQLEKMLFYYLVTKAYTDDPIADVERMLYNVFKDSYDKIQMKILIQNKRGVLFDKNIVEFVNEEFQTNNKIRLSAEAVKMVFGENSCFLKMDSTFSSGLCRLIEHQKIQEKELFYNPEEVNSISILSDFLKKDQFDGIVKRLRENNMRTGLTVLLHGYPGTGKTESVYQLAKKSGRNILMVNISEIRDKWVGESEKRLKSVFETYVKSLKRFDHTPILLFNESDALIGKRINIRSSVDQMNNAMQNILLQEMEDFNGILMATTNLTGNLDDAFERRFLYKIKFNKPCKEAKLMIWRNKLKDLSENDLKILSEEFDFSGGQIENISRKLFLDAVLMGRKLYLEDILKYCREEVLTGGYGNSKIGF